MEKLLLTGLVILGALLTAAPAAAEDLTKLRERAKWWTDARFGMFIHWGVYAVPADATNKDGGYAAAEWYLTNKQMQLEDYMKFAPQFNPVHFDAREWVKTARDAGMKYIVLTSKHHEGFCMWDTKTTDWSIVRGTPYGKDPVKDLARECRRAGIRLCFYYSIMDWHHPDYLPRRPWEQETRPADGADMERYISYMKTHLKELVEKYGPLGVLWFDGEWEPTWTHEHGLDLYNYVRSLQPDILVNNRVDKGRAGMEGITMGAEFAGDFGTPEQQIPATGFEDGRLWETCMTMNGSWGYAENDPNWKSSVQLIRNLVDIASKGGNFLLNVGPKADGTFPEAVNERLADMGQWMKANGDSIYGTSANPLQGLPHNVRCTQKGSTFYLHVFDWPEGPLDIQTINLAPSSARVLGTGEKVSVRGAVSGGIRIPRPQKLDPAVTVIEMKMPREFLRDEKKEEAVLKAPAALAPVQPTAS